MKTVAREVKLVQPRTRIALPEGELRNRASRARILSPHPSPTPANSLQDPKHPLVPAPKA